MSVSTAINLQGAEPFYNKTVQKRIVGKFAEIP